MSLPLPATRQRHLVAVPDERPNQQSTAARHDLFFRCYVLLAAASCMYGAVVLAGGGDRFTDASFRGPSDLVSWLPFFGPWVYWGAMFLIHGVLMIVFIKRDLAINILRFVIVVYTFLAIAFLLSVFREPTATGAWCVIFAAFALLALFVSDHLGEHGWKD